MKYSVYYQILLVLFILLIPVSGFSFSSKISVASLPVSKIQTITTSNTVSEIGIDLQVSTINEHEYHKSLETEIYSKVEKNWRLNSRFDWQNERYFSISWQETTIQQKNIIFGDNDFNIQGSGPVFGLGFSFGKQAKITAELRVEDYKDTATDSFYTLQGSQGSKGNGGSDFYSGFVEASIAMTDSWLFLSFKRSRDTEPLYNQVMNRAELNIRAEEISGIAYGVYWSQAVEIRGSVYYEQYETGIADQFNVNAEIAYKPPALKALHFSLGSGYYTEEEETIVNFTADYGMKWRHVDLIFQYQCEYSDNEKSLLHQGNTFVKYYLNNQLSLWTNGEYGVETGEDHDRVTVFSAGIEYIF